MNLFNFLINFFILHDQLAYFVLFLGSFFDILIGPGFFIYGEFFFLSGSILAGAGILNIWLVAGSCILGGILGDSASYAIGRRYGSKFVEYYFKKENKFFNFSLVKRAHNFFQKKGKKAIFFSRFLGPVAWVMPFIAGTMKMNYKNFLIYNIPAATISISWYLIVGYVLGFSYSLFLPKLEKYLFIFIIITLGITVWLSLKKDSSKE